MVMQRAWSALAIHFGYSGIAKATKIAKIAATTRTSNRVKAFEPWPSKLDLKMIFNPTVADSQ